MFRDLKDPWSWQVSAGWEPRVSSALSFLPSLPPAKITAHPGNAAVHTPRRRTHTENTLLAAPEPLLPHHCRGTVLRA